MPADVHESKLVLHWPGSARTFNPFSNLSLPSWFPVWFVFDQLVHLDADAQVVPQLAERWDVSDDGRRYVFHLREGVTWHDGEPFTAADVAFTYTMLLDPRAGSRYQSLALPVAEPKSAPGARPHPSPVWTRSTTERSRSSWPSPTSGSFHDGIPDCSSTRPRR